MKKILVLFFLLSASAQAQTNFENLKPLLDQVQPDSIRRHIAFLADDRMRGRLPGTPEFQVAIDYIIKHYKMFGMKPGGDKGSFMQAVKLRKARINAAGISMELKGASTKALTFGEDVVLFPHFEEKSTRITAPLVFAGYGISAPDMNYDDFKGIDVKGKIIVIVSGAPDNFPSTIRSHSLGRTTIVQTAISKGAVGVLYKTSTNVNLKNLAYAATESGAHVALSPKGIMYYPSYAGGAGMGLKVYGYISNEVFNSIAGQTEGQMTAIFNGLKNGTPSSFDLNTIATVTYTSNHTDIDSYNVVGIIEGSDSKLKNEYVVHTAHLDHVGVGTAVKGDSIYNGAHDNASGVASTLEVARLYSKLISKPKRSIIFVMVTGEEMGMLGSSFFSNFPTVPKKSIVANVNMDMPTIIAPLMAVVPLGAPHSTLINQVNNAAGFLGLDVEQDPEPEQNRFIRSDQYSFVIQGIPALHIKYGDKTSEPGKKLSDDVKVWRADTYHKPQDQLDTGVFDFNAGKKYVHLNFLISYQVAQETGRPQWNEGDFFGKQFGEGK
ncbi:MAG TPA: M28 family peptidase [Sphingobacteriaceae bacterium]